MVLTIITVAAAYVDLGNLNIIVAIAIALVEGDLRHPVLHAREATARSSRGSLSAPVCSGC